MNGTRVATAERWAVWYPKAGSTGVLIARGELRPTETLLVHAAGDIISVEVSDDAGQTIAKGQDLARTAQTPMARLRRKDKRVMREDIWPEQADLGSLVLLPGGEVGALKAWWHADDHKEWRWQVEFYNSIRGG